MTRKRGEAYCAVGVGLIAFVLYARTIGFSYVDWDDLVFLVRNPVLAEPSLNGLARILRPGGIDGEWLYVPITYLSFLGEAILFGGMNSSCTHVINSLIHAVNAVLVFRLGRRLGLAAMGAAAAALLFACHPLQVEAVAWAMGRKDLLAAGLALGALECWGAKSTRFQWVALALVAAAILAKPTAVVLPVILLLSDWNAQRVCRERIVRLVPVVVFAFVCLVVNLRLGGGEGGMDLARNGDRVWQLPWLACDFLQRFLLLQEPDFLYLPHRLTADAISIGPWLAVAFLGLTAWIAWRTEQRRIVFGVGLALVSLLPVLNVVFASKIFVTADRFSYFSLAGLSIALASLPLPRFSWLPVLLLAVTAIPATEVRMSAWRDTGTLQAAAVRRNPHSPVFAYAAGRRLEKLGLTDSAVDRYRILLQAEPLDSRVHLRLGLIAARRGLRTTAHRHFSIAAGVAPGSRSVWRHWINLHIGSDPELGRQLINRASSIHPDWTELSRL